MSTWNESWGSIISQGTDIIGDRRTDECVYQVVNPLMFSIFCCHLMNYPNQHSLSAEAHSLWCKHDIPKQLTDWFILGFRINIFTFLLDLLDLVVVILLIGSKKLLLPIWRRCKMFPRLMVGFLFQERLKRRTQHTQFSEICILWGVSRRMGGRRGELWGSHITQWFHCKWNGIKDCQIYLEICVPLSTQTSCCFRKREH